MCDRAQLGCACKIRIASLGSAAAGAGVAAVAVFVTQHLVLAAAALGVCAVGAVALAHAVRRSARLSVVHWPSQVALPARASVRAEQVRPAQLPAPRLAIPAPAPAVIPGVVLSGVPVRDPWLS